MCLLALSCSKNHLFVLPSGGGRSSVYGTDPHFDSASGALPWWRSRTHSGGRKVRAFTATLTHPTPLVRRPRGTGRIESTCLDLDTVRSVKARGWLRRLACRARFHFGDWHALPARSRACSVRWDDFVDKCAECAGSRSRLDRRLLTPTLVRLADPRRSEQQARLWASNEHARRPKHAPSTFGMSPIHGCCRGSVMR